MGLTIACVYNDVEVRRHCLDRSIAAAATSGVEVQYLPIDNTTHQFASAGAALNHAVRLAEHDVVVLAHQDVYLHDLPRLAEAAAALDDPDWGVLGSCGLTSSGELVGRLRDRVILIGAPAPAPVEVQTLDEVLLMARRETFLEHPLSEDPLLAWHAYAVEYALRMRALGRRAGAVDTAITHNSLTVNLARLDDAHLHVGDLFPAELPIRTTCGTVTGRRDWRDLPVLRSQRWRRTWLKQSAAAARVHAATGQQVVIADIAHEVDVIDFSHGDPLHLVNADPTGAFARVAGATTVLDRRDRPVVMAATRLDAVADTVAPLSERDHVLVTGLTLCDLPGLWPALSGQRSWLAGVQWGEVWLVGGPSATHLPQEWGRPQAVPLRVG
ncbi:glycosyltransferase [Nocardioides oleivorans]|uniref:glycosyltransferase n=1 Tax=Nocardioides oleivorans TaxID=273676 RepID=UPI0013EBCED4|nr:glycosyltransferase [Nocardioides oleivorans]